ncbi:PI-PLC X domain-containing protein 3-like isoform X2 [Leptopilina boulardi]|nr:PI-PLC X domain-containing protein 3-like isoform X2 [Leptopilina boulardi]
MTQLPAIIRNIPIIHLAIPGSHNSMTYTINSYNNFGGEFPLVDDYNINVSSAIKWMINQDKSVKEQLNGGIRYLDLRVCAQSDSDSIYFVHGLCGSEITEPLQEINEWLSSHPSEFVILDFQYFHSFSEDNHRQLVKKIKNIFNGKICPFSKKINEITLQWLSSEKYQILIIYREIIEKNFYNFWPSDMWPKNSSDIMNFDEFEEFLNKTIVTRSTEIGCILQCIPNPQGNYIIQEDLLSDDLRKEFTENFRDDTCYWINIYPAGPEGINVVTTDYVSYSDFLFSKTVIKRNASHLYEYDD